MQTLIKLTIFIVFVIIVLTIIGMVIITNKIFNIKNNIILINDDEIAMSRISLVVYWCICIIGFMFGAAMLLK